MSDRIRKVNELIREEASKAISEILGRENLVTVTAVETSRDMREATIWVSILGDEKKSLAELEEKRSEIQHAITSKMYAKYTPKIEFKSDHSLAYAQRIQELLNEDKED